jgi:SpoVK/Ycf46/Vps4 family AAA+-type ATPase
VTHTVEIQVSDETLAALQCDPRSYAAELRVAAAAAEAMASALGRQIMVVSYAEVQTCFIGETEKNIVRTFREASEADAVLFWDEADAMFFDRGSAQRSWEVRDVNVLLQELERFQGLCILATNRRVTLDAALERRIAIKVELERPDRGSRVSIWRKLLPAKLPIEGVDVERLADEDLSGGEIKNVVLNAARLALVRGPQGPIRASDFEQAIRMEREGRWSRRIGPIGFDGKIRPTSSDRVARAF